MTARKVRAHYGRAPVTEAVIDIQTENSAPISIGDIQSLSEELRTDFPTRLPLHQLQMGVQVGPEGAEFTKDQQVLGYRLDRTGRVLQLRAHGFTYSHLPPYTDWPTFSKEAESYWNLYAATFKPAASTRAAVRMINRIPLPSGEVELARCLNIYPSIPESLPGGLQSLAMQVQLPMKHVDDAAIAILQLYNATATPGSRSIILDIDVIVQKRMPPVEVFTTLNIIGDAKDDVFEACITDAVREMIV